MAKIFVLCITLAALVVIANSKSLSHSEDCLDCAQAVGTEEKAFKRPKRSNEGLSFAKDLTLGIIGTTWNGIIEVNKIKAAGGPQPIFIGPGTGNTNRVMFNYPSGYNA